MAEQHAKVGLDFRYKFYCPNCGEVDHLVEVMAFEAHQVNRNLTYVRLVHGEVERYDCYLCGEEIDPEIGIKENVEYAPF